MSDIIFGGFEKSIDNVKTPVFGSFSKTNRRCSVTCFVRKWSFSFISSGVVFVRCAIPTLSSFESECHIEDKPSKRVTKFHAAGAQASL